jgi:hypothetical protein
MPRPNALAYCGKLYKNFYKICLRFYKKILEKDEEEFFKSEREKKIVLVAKCAP